MFNFEENLKKLAELEKQRQTALNNYYDCIANRRTSYEIMVAEYICLLILINISQIRINCMKDYMTMQQDGCVTHAAHYTYQQINNRVLLT
jgi:hypothetical protein